SFARYNEVRKQIVENEKLKLDHKNESELMEMVETELTSLHAKETALELDLKVAILPPDPNDSRNTILEIRAGTGGDEAALFAGVLFRMYCRYAESRGWKVE